MKIVSETLEIQAPAHDVFAHIDDIRNVGWHMTGQSSMAMMGSNLTVEVLSERRTGVGATYRCSGKIMGLTLDFSESVTKYVPNREKVWHRIGEPRLWICAGSRRLSSAWESGSPRGSAATRLCMRRAPRTSPTRRPPARTVASCGSTTGFPFLTLGVIFVASLGLGLKTLKGGAVRRT